MTQSLGQASRVGNQTGGRVFLFLYGRRVRRPVWQLVGSASAEKIEEVRPAQAIWGAPPRIA